MAEYCPDHPDIVAIMNTGYPTWIKPTSVFCEECGADITDEDKYFDSHHDYLCERCLLYLHRTGEY